MKKIQFTIMLCALIACGKDEDPKPIIDPMADEAIYQLNTKAKQQGITLANDVSVVVFKNANNEVDDSYIEGRTVHVDGTQLGRMTSFGRTIIIAKLILKVYYPENTCIDKYKVDIFINGYDSDWFQTMQNAFGVADCPN